MDSTLHSVVLTLLKRHPTVAALDADTVSKDSKNPTIRVDDNTYDLLTSQVDLLLQDGGREDGSRIQAARLILTIRPNTPDGRNGDPPPPMEVAAHAFVWSDEQDTKPDRTEVILDQDGLTRGPRPASPAQRASLVLTRPRPPPASDGQGLGGTYRAYVAAINARDMSTTLPRFCHPVVTHNGRPLPLPQYQRLMEDAQAAVPDITFDVSDLVADEKRQMVAARLELRGRPTQAFAGVTPREGEASEVRFSEIVFYWFDQGKIREVVSLVDLEAYRRQVRS